ncbi:MAG: anhydro-N-acetylmuramic acid kinase [Armatimonadetes bacterium]|nr:anhydro-N-acetylmuramic acid kinase [Armatimonadota bacterium]
MSGTSADGIDAALVEISIEEGNLSTRLVAFEKTPFSSDVRDLIFRLTAPEARVPDLARINFLLGEIFAEAALSVIGKAGLDPKGISFIASHGQTVFHGPEPTMVAGRAISCTLQIGEPSIIAQKTGITTIADFRPADMGAGGQGAPLVPYADFLLFGGQGEPRVALNLGGIANVTYVPGERDMGRVLAFDTGPGNVLLDEVARRSGWGEFDPQGIHALEGHRSEDLLSSLMAHPYILRDPPKSTGREMFGPRFLSEILESGFPIAPDDLAATLAAFTAEAVAAQIRWFLDPKGPPVEILVSGGGARNPAIMKELASRLPEKKVRPIEELGLSSEAKEAVAFAILGYETLHGRPSNVCGATGAQRRVVLGKICPA